MTANESKALFTRLDEARKQSKYLLTLENSRRIAALLFLP
jgi:hypothetical protein